jgi:hypothetical protein
MKAIVIFIEKKQKIVFLNPITKNKTKQNVIFQLHQFSIFLGEISGIGPCGKIRQSLT